MFMNVSKSGGIFLSYKHKFCSKYLQQWEEL
jgi:hypothetical protein